jgi:membrane peptidoglycan carboxypeptidase
MNYNGTDKNGFSDLPSRHGLGTPQAPRSRLPLALCAASSLAIALAVLSPRTNDNALAADPSPKNQGQIFENDPVLQAQLSRGAQIEKSSLDQMAMRESGPSAGRVYPIPDLPHVEVISSRDGDIALSDRPNFEKRLGDRYASITKKNNFVFYTLDPELQEQVSRIVAQAQASHVAIVAMNPSNGAVLAIAGKSKSIEDIEYHAGFPAASLFKVVTAAAAVEHAGIAPHSLIPFRGGNYTLNQANYYPDARRDQRIMSVGEAMGRSCNPVFGHIGVKYLNGQILSRYARQFGFNRPLEFEAPLPESSAWIPQDNLYELSRTSAGFGEVRVSPIHAAAFMSGIANGGMLPRPQIVDTIVSPDGTVIHKQKNEVLQRIVEESTAQSLMQMMRNTTTIGTSRREFMRGSTPTLGTIDVAGKTGTLSGDNPQGLNNWFIGAAPISNPQIAVAVITVDPQRSSKASHLARLVFQRYFGVTPAEPAPSNYRSAKHSRLHNGTRKSSGKKASSKKSASYSKKKTKKK